MQDVDKMNQISQNQFNFTHIRGGGGGGIEGSNLAKRTYKYIQTYLLGLSKMCQKVKLSTFSYTENVTQ